VEGERKGEGEKGKTGDSMDCEEKDALLIFLLVLTGGLAAILTGGIFILCRRKVSLALLLSVKVL
jgi:hypothetical protein